MLNAANEVAVAAFLDGRIRYTDIAPPAPRRSRGCRRGRCARSTTRSPPTPRRARVARAWLQASRGARSAWIAVTRSCVAFLVVLGVLVVFHELGHYVVARLVRRQGAALLGRLRPHRLVAPLRPRPHRVGASPRSRSAAT